MNKKNPMNKTSDEIEKTSANEVIFGNIRKKM